MHNIETISDSRRNSYILCAFGNRFVTVLKFDLSSPNLSLIFEDYHCDNAVYCKINSNELSLYLQTLSSHGLFQVIKLSWDFDKNSNNVDVTCVHLQTSACYTGHIFQYSSPTSSSLSSPVNKTLVFCGSTFGNIHIFKIPNNNVTQSSVAPSLSLCAQKGVIFSLDFCCLASEESSSKKSFRLASCAEDRSIAVWSTSVESNGGVKDFSFWELVYNLKAGSISDDSVIFESRIWCVRVGDWGIVATGEATGGNDGAICIRELTNYRNNCDKSECIILPCHELATNNTKESMIDSHETKIISPRSHQVSFNFKEKDFARILFFGSCGRLFYVTNLGLIYTYFYLNDPIVRQVCPKIHRIFEDANTEFSEKPNGSMVSFLGGYLTCCTSLDRSYVIIGNISGYLLLVRLLEDSPFMEWLDIVNINDKIMKIIWINSSYVIIGLTNGDSFIIPLLKVENTLSFGKIFTIIQGSNSSKNMKWLNTSSELIPVHFNNTEISDKQILVTGTRDGGIYSYVVNFLIESTKMYSPVWFSKSCHKSGGCTSMLAIKGQSDCHLLSCGRTYGDVKYWSIQSNGSLNLLATVLRSDHITWIEKLYRSIDNKIYALGFQSKYFKAISLNHKCLQAANQLDWSFTCPVRQDGCFVVDCGGGNHYWDWFLPNGTTIKTNKLTNCENGNYNYNAGIVVDNSESIEMKSSSLCPVFASINKGKVVIRSDPHNCILSYRANNCNFEPIYLNPSLHGQTINTCLLLNKNDIFGVQNYPKGDSTDQHIELYCFAGGEDTLISSWKLSLPMTSTDPCINEPISSFPQHHRGHISSVRCIDIPYILINNINSTQETVSKRYMLSAGGRGQICLWRLVSSNEPALVAGFLGSTKIRHNEYCRVGNVSDDNDTVQQDNGSDHEDDLKTAKFKNVSSDIRVMALDCVQVPRQEDQLDDNILVIAGFSQAASTLIHVQPSSGSNTEYPKFSEIERINPTILPTNKSDNHISCCLDLKLLQITSYQISFAISNSRGELHGWIIPWCPLRGYCFADNSQCTSKPYIYHQDNDIDGIFGLRLDSAYHWMLNCQPIPPFHIQNPLAFNCITSPIIDVTLSDSNTISTIIVVGGDDGSIRIAQIPLDICHSSKSNVRYPQWSTSCVKHFSSVVKITTCPNFELTNEFLYYFLSLASDQRVILWRLDKISSCDFRLNPMKYFLLCGLGDPHSLSVTSINIQSLCIYTKEYKNKCFVLVVGSGAQLIQVF
ncbi:unnamed protein product [Schistosoma margrebowiei]|uniref:tRNA (34-2'-O)-methyltransferase regulator WDR6 n=1 Tax=Schistosoma margrebowiei TaxID=48269 RepID=A0A183LG27_9TREM|nr:unnamed protein product [Schistosoma margrebowiei]